MFDKGVDLKNGKSSLTGKMPPCGGGVQGSSPGLTQIGSEAQQEMHWPCKPDNRVRISAEPQFIGCEAISLTKRQTEMN